MAGQGRGKANDERISYVDEQILHALFDFHYLTAEQLTRLRYSKASLNYAREQLKRLYDRGYFGRTYGPRSQAAGSTPWVYYLARKGLAHFKEHGYELERRYRPSEERSRSDQFLFHTLAVNDVLIAARLLERHVGGLELASIRHDLDLKRNPVKLETGKVDTATGEKELESVSPDGWVSFRAAVLGKDRPVLFPLLLELDRNTEPVRRIKRKIRGLLTYIQGPYRELFGTKYVTVAFIVEEASCRSKEGAEKRVRDLCRWTEEALSELGKQAQGKLFVFTTLPLGEELDPERFFLAPRAVQPFTDLPLSLLDLPGALPVTGTNGQSKPFPAERQAVRSEHRVPH
jgi:hypothetical protein